ncbi:CUB domain-containing protein-like [Strongylocentrotus purpuratus]|uniref:Apple domain-containing protein n=1 Tax=Strongylocentrotus purpuratus TaxID=7668 RepID=A0A7M7HPR9_STRPU|nr:CUB domain-containing protein-like [Strongylocentrotus purpuratus]
MELGHHANTNLGSLLTICRIAVVIQVLSWGSFCSGIECQVCQTVNSLAECDSTQVCASNEICRTEIRTQAASTYKMECKQDQACLNEQEIYKTQCTGVAGSVCVTCCDTDLCNAPTPDPPAATAATTNPPTSIDAATTVTEAATTKATTSDAATTVTEAATTKATSTQPPTHPIAPSGSSHISSSLYKLYRSAQQVNPQYVFDTGQAGSLIACTMTCAQTANCKSFGYNSVGRLCYIVGSDASDLTFTNTATCNHYIPVI